ncbi:gliding motility-associated C-terminal domain-containing protein [Hymenobacter humi]|uniref:Gliding motility-associated C-terminal domain-containing protein n=1 Tax=Hymenobacter humi TaxID=1411620 RepID=A0ABW2U768_9BACT
MLYSKTITLAANTYDSPQGYYVAVERCCRNSSISNIVSPNSAAQTFYLEFPAVVRRGQPFVDSTPRIAPPLADYACINELFYYDFGGQDADGDSLVYDLVTPLNGHSDSNEPKPTAADPGPYPPITWLPPAPATPGAPAPPPLSTLNQIPGAPTLSIARATGRLTVRPTSQGLFVFGVRCSEYRKGEKIGEARRDFQLMVLTCPTNTKPNLAVLPAPTGNVRYRPGRDTLRLAPGTNHCVRLRFTDPDPNSRLTLSLSPVNFSGVMPNFTTASSGAVRMAGAPDTLTATLCFPECMNTAGRVFLLDVVVGDDGCSLPKRDTVRVAFVAVPPPNSAPTIATTAGPALPLRVRVGDLVSFEVNGADLDDPVRLEMAGKGFSPADLGATLSQGTVGNQQRGRFTWRVDCRSVSSDSVRTFEFTAATSPCSTREAVTVSVPVIIQYANRAPALLSDLPPPRPGEAIPVVELPLGRVFTATFTGTDPDRDGLMLTATGTTEDGKEGFDLTTAGMRFDTRNGSGVANGTFTWDVSCLAANLHRSLVVTFRLIDATCTPLPQFQRVRLQVKSPDSLAVKLYNVITPNRDGLNDEFKLPDLPPNFCDVQFTNIKIFSRWGQQVFESPNRDFRWPGQGTGGLYYYYVTYTDGRKYRGWLEVRP